MFDKQFGFLMVLLCCFLTMCVTLIFRNPLSKFVGWTFSEFRRLSAEKLTVKKTCMAEKHVK